MYKSIVTACVNIAYCTEIGDTCNICSFDVSNKAYSSFFGFTQDETDKVLASFNALDKNDDIKKWYGSYRFGHDYVYCPDSVLCYCQALEQNRTQSPQAYGTDLKDNALIYHFIKNSIKMGYFGNISALQALMDGKAALIEHYGFSSYPNLKECTNFDTFAAILLHKGYLTYTDSSQFMRSRVPISLKIPNLKIRHIFEDNIVAFNADNAAIFKNHGSDLLEALMHNDLKKAQDIINFVLKTYISIRPSGSEQYYHGFMQELLNNVALSNNIKILDESESGLGYCDIILEDSNNKRVVILELKKAKDHVKNRLKAAHEAIEQIKEKNYAAPFLDYYEQIYGIGIGFFDKGCDIVSLGNMDQINISDK